jgi:hypothetical protein
MRRKLRCVGIFLGGFPIIPTGWATGFFLSRWLVGGGAITPFIVVVLADIICLYCLVRRADWIVAELKDQAL